MKVLLLFNKKRSLIFKGYSILLPCLIIRRNGWMSRQLKQGEAQKEKFISVLERQWGKVKLFQVPFEGNHLGRKQD